MRTKLETEDGKAGYKKRKQTVEPVFGIIKGAMGASPASTCAFSPMSPPSGC